MIICCSVLVLASGVSAYLEFFKRDTFTYLDTNLTDNPSIYTRNFYFKYIYSYKEGVDCYGQSIVSYGDINSFENALDSVDSKAYYLIPETEPFVSLKPNYYIINDICNENDALIVQSFCTYTESYNDKYDPVYPIYSGSYCGYEINSVFYKVNRYSGYKEFTIEPFGESLDEEGNKFRFYKVMCYYTSIFQGKRLFGEIYFMPSYITNKGFVKDYISNYLKEI